MSDELEDGSEASGNSVIDRVVALYEKLRSVGSWAVVLAAVVALVIAAEIVQFARRRLTGLTESVAVDAGLLYLVAGIAIGAGVLAVVVRRVFPDSPFRRGVAAAVAAGYAMVLLLIGWSTEAGWPLELALWAGVGGLLICGVMYRFREDAIGRVVYGTLALIAVTAIPLIELEERGVMAAGDAVGPLWFVSCAWLAGLLLARRTGIYGERRWIENTPRSSAEGVMIGDNALEGTARAVSPLVAPYSQRDCIYYDSVLQEERERSIDGDGDRTEKFWVTLESDSARTGFELRDETGRIYVDPAGAELNTGERVVDDVFQSSERRRGMRVGSGHQEGTTTGRRRRRESIIEDGTTLHVLGYARIRDDGEALEIADDDAGHLFEISTDSRQSVISDRRVSQAMTSVLAFLVWAAAPVVPLVDLEIFAGQPVMAGALMVAWLAIGLGWAALGPLLVIYNGLVDLKNRRERARSMLDVEYQRRNSLIPNLAELVEAFAAGEEAIQKQLAILRNRRTEEPPDSMGLDAVGEAFDEQTRALRSLFVLSEQNPELQSDTHFQTLLEELTRCEDKIALARTYYNDSVERLNNRVGTFPDLLVAPIAGVGSSSYLEFDDLAAARGNVESRPDLAAEQKTPAKAADGV